ncbi:MAG: DinB family protein, partial [Calditrichaeota bacterium]|nr:DinB family protein [Calditrichota bacterium]MCB0315553.1 DinB family protein [Calditrichota bacterium]
MDSRLQRQFEQMEAVRESVFDMLKFYSPDQLAFKPAPDKWSVIQVLQHLLISEQGTYQYLTRKNQAESLPDAGWGAGVRSRLLKVGLLSPLRFK